LKEEQHASRGEEEGRKRGARGNDSTRSEKKKKEEFRQPSKNPGSEDWSTGIFPVGGKKKSGRKKGRAASGEAAAFGILSVGGHRVAPEGWGQCLDRYIMPH